MGSTHPSVSRYYLSLGQTYPFKTCFSPSKSACHSNRISDCPQVTPSGHLRCDLKSLNHCPCSHSFPLYSSSQSCPFLFSRPFLRLKASSNAHSLTSIRLQGQNLYLSLLISEVSTYSLSHSWIRKPKCYFWDLLSNRIS